MSENLFNPNFVFDNPKVELDSRTVFDRFLEALELTEAEREDVLIKVSNLRPHVVGDLSKPFDISYDVMNETKGTVVETVTYPFHPSVLNQLASIDNPPIPLSWLKRSFTGIREPIYDYTGNSHEGNPTIDLRQQILQHAFKNRPRMKRTIRFERPYYLKVDYKSINDGMLWVNKPEKLVMGVVGENYPTEWSTYEMVNALHIQVNKTFDNVTWAYPYVTDAGTFRVTFHSKDPQWSIEPKKGDVVGFGGVFRDNPYGGGSMCWHPRTLRLACVNGMTYHDSMGSVIVGHRSWVSMVTDLIKSVLTPRIDPITEEPLNSFEARLPIPLPISDYLEDHKLLYKGLSQVMVLRLLSIAQKLKERYQIAAEMVISDYKACLDWICRKYEIGDTVKDRLFKVSFEDVTIPDPTKEDFTVYDMSNVFSTYANAPLSDEQRKAYSTIAGEIIMRPQIAKQLVTIKAK